MGRWFWIGCRFRRVRRESNEAGKSYTYPKSRHPVFGSHSHFTLKITRHCISAFTTPCEMLLPKNSHFRTDLEPQARLTQRKSGSWNNSGIKSFLAPVVWKNIDNWGSETVHSTGSHRNGKRWTAGQGLPPCPFARWRLISTYRFSRCCWTSSRACSLCNKEGLRVFSLLFNAMS